MKASTNPCTGYPMLSVGELLNERVKVAFLTTKEKTLLFGQHAIEEEPLLTSTTENFGEDRVYGFVRIEIGIWVLENLLGVSDFVAIT